MEFYFNLTFIGNCRAIGCQVLFSDCLLRINHLLSGCLVNSCLLISKFLFSHCLFRINHLLSNCCLRSDALVNSCTAFLHGEGVVSSCTAPSSRRLNRPILNSFLLSGNLVSDCLSKMLLLDGILVSNLQLCSIGFLERSDLLLLCRCSGVLLVSRSRLFGGFCIHHCGHVLGNELFNLRRVIRENLLCVGLLLRIWFDGCRMQAVNFFLFQLLVDVSHVILESRGYLQGRFSLVSARVSCGRLERHDHSRLLERHVHSRLWWNAFPRLFVCTFRLFVCTFAG
mmetsp:Transcript_17341/g.31948  ORF Transcript_17341/g.31948 Transcript_17341/m.31948 type:complete len:283 (-) Transcript_17341:1290-2138(-)